MGLGVGQKPIKYTHTRSISVGRFPAFRVIVVQTADAPNWQAFPLRATVVRIASLRLILVGPFVAVDGSSMSGKCWNIWLKCDDAMCAARPLNHPKNDETNNGSVGFIETAGCMRRTRPRATLWLRPVEYASMENWKFMVFCLGNHLVNHGAHCYSFSWANTHYTYAPLTHTHTHTLTKYKCIALLPLQPRTTRQQKRLCVIQ